MKTLSTFFAAMLISIATLGLNQNTGELLKNYLNVKDALVKSDSKHAAEYAHVMSIGIDAGTAFTQKDNLQKSVKELSETTDLETQRILFATVSDLMWQIVKNTDKVSQTVYYQYCPMKEAGWLSASSSIRNPYYGTKMLTCGEVKETKKK